MSVWLHMYIHNVVPCSSLLGSTLKYSLVPSPSGNGGTTVQAIESNGHSLYHNNHAHESRLIQFL